MKITPKFEGNIDSEGKLHIKDIVKFRQFLLTIKGSVTVTVKRTRNYQKRTDSENRYYWSVIVKMVAYYMGDTIESAHDALRLKFLINPSKRMPSLKSTSDLTISEFEDYMTSIRTYMSVEHNLYIPKPNECEY